MDAYERLLGDAMAGDATLFARQDVVEAAWAIVDPVIHGAEPAVRVRAWLVGSAASGRPRHRRRRVEYTTVDGCHSILSTSCRLVTRWTTIKFVTQLL